MNKTFIKLLEHSMLEAPFSMGHLLQVMENVTVQRSTLLPENIPYYEIFEKFHIKWKLHNLNFLKIMKRRKVCCHSFIQLDCGID